ncbi:hypothetical protein TELCIR_10024 [Teladorsagia circumcincta]|uniref:Uncharacterized protein n=1 Tax=Teladorsagia circumcincta TaxID=45464 RepID=A0A2G9UDG1_TELCI|nr:hypothetical protein TELCIR_10024 [Teladorsagia circumcincta]
MPDQLCHVRPRVRVVVAPMVTIPAELRCAAVVEATRHENQALSRRNTQLLLTILYNAFSFYWVWSNKPREHWF